MPFHRPFPRATHSPCRASFALALIAGAALVAGASPSAAQVSQDAAAADYLGGLKQCRAVAEPSARLACFDEAAAAILAAADTGEVQIVDREAVRETRRSLFGFSLPKLGIFGSNDDEGERLEKTMQSEITGVQRLDSDSWRIAIAEGSVWQVSDAHRGFKPRVGAPVEFERAAMGSYWVRVDGQIGVKGRRVE